MVTWETKTIGNILRGIRLGGNYKNSPKVTQYPLIKMGNISRGSINLDKVDYVQDVEPDDLDRLRFGDVLFNTRNTPELVGKVAVWRNELSCAYYNSNLMRLEFNECDNFFMNYLFNTKQMIKKLQEIAIGTTSVAAIYTRDLFNVEIQLPPLPEQRRIAEALSDTDALLAAMEKLIAKKRAVKQGAMQELLTGKRRLPGFSSKWVIKRFGDGILKVGHGKSQHEIETPSGKYPILATGGVIGRADCYLYDKPSVLIGRKGTIDKPQYMNTPFWTIDTLFYTVVGEEHCAKYLYYLFCTIDWNGYNEASGVPSLSSKVIKDIEVTVPSKSEQTAIAEILSDMDAEIDALTTKLDKLRNIKQGMMSELLTGHIRLTEQQAAAAPEAVAAPKIYEFPKREPEATAVQTGGHNQQFDDAVMIAGIVNVLYSDKFPLGRKKVQKCLYLLRRHQDESTAAFKKKAAGPYADEVRYKGGEPIARSANYIATTTAKDKGTTFARGAEIGKALCYIQNWGKQADIKWVADKLKFKKVDELELLATVDMAICDLTEAGTPVSVASIKHLIATNEEWKAKLKKQTFNDANIARAIRELQSLL